jgi:hypothetical protein
LLKVRAECVIFALLFFRNFLDFIRVMILFDHIGLGKRKRRREGAGALSPDLQPSSRVRSRERRAAVCRMIG